MAGKYEQFEDFILAEVGRGQSFAAICRALDAKGCPIKFVKVGGVESTKVDITGLRNWLLRRADRIQKRQALINPVSIAVPTPVPMASTETHSVGVASTKLVQVVSKQQAETTSQQGKTSKVKVDLQALIRSQEQDSDPLNVGSHVQKRGKAI